MLRKGDLILSRGFFWQVIHDELFGFVDVRSLRGGAGTVFETTRNANTCRKIDRALCFHGMEFWGYVRHHAPRH